MLADAFGWTHSEMMRLTIRQIRAYHAQIDRMNAARSLRQLDIILAPNMKSEDVAAMRNAFMRRARGEGEEDLPDIHGDNETLQRIIRSGGRF